MLSRTNILVISDTHGCTARLRWVFQKERADAIFFLGDGLSDLRQAADSVPPGCPIYQVRGNCDFGMPDPAEGLAPFAGVLFFYTHGHLLGVKEGDDRLREYAADRGADVALFGHTHRPRLVKSKTSPTLFNPGSLLDTRSYGVISVMNGRCSFGWKKVPRTE